MLKYHFLSLSYVLHQGNHRTTPAGDFSQDGIESVQTPVDCVFCIPGPSVCGRGGVSGRDVEHDVCRISGTAAVPLALRDGRSATCLRYRNILQRLDSRVWRGIGPGAKAILSSYLLYFPILMLWREKIGRDAALWLRIPRRRSARKSRIARTVGIGYRRHSVVFPHYS